jgi:endonuclease/exonuclease/phosphatase family metal-dependent hydrolase
MTMNLRFGLADDKENAWDLRKDLVSELLHRNPADIIGFQEVNHFQAEFLAQILPDHHPLGRHNPGLPWWQSNMIFFHKDWTCLGFRHHFLSPFPDILSKLEGSQWPRQCVMAWLRKGDDHILAVNTHFDFDARVQAKSAGLILGFMDNFPPGLPVIITGDFNTTPGSPAYEIFCSHGFGEVFKGESPGTYHEFTGKPENRHIDWILYKGGISAAHPEVVTHHYQGQYPSDHFPVRCEFTWRAPS